jgi:1,4-dihydroxy-2-naphthoate octaprenyltransferase
LAVPTRSNRTRNGRAALAVLLGALSVACVPAAIAVAHYTAVKLIEAGYAVPPGLVFGFLALYAARSARRRSERTIGRVGGARTASTGTFLGALGIYLAIAGALSVGVYELLQYLSA